MVVEVVGGAGKNVDFRGEFCQMDGENFGGEVARMGVLESCRKVGVEKWCKSGGIMNKVV